MIVAYLLEACNENPDYLRRFGGGSPGTQIAFFCFFVCQPGSAPPGQTTPTGSGKNVYQPARFREIANGRRTDSGGTMTTEPTPLFLDRLRDTLSLRDLAEQTDGQLLERFKKEGCRLRR